jgi:hypothetical protein
MQATEIAPFHVSGSIDRKFLKSEISTDRKSDKKIPRGINQL